MSSESSKRPIRPDPLRRSGEHEARVEEIVAGYVSAAPVNTKHASKKSLPAT